MVTRLELGTVEGFLGHCDDVVQQLQTFFELTSLDDLDAPRVDNRQIGLCELLQVGVLTVEFAHIFAERVVNQLLENCRFGLDLDVNLFNCLLSCRFRIRQQVRWVGQTGNVVVGDSNLHFLRLLRHLNEFINCEVLQYIDLARLLCSLCQVEQLLCVELILAFGSQARKLFHAFLHLWLYWLEY